MFHSCSRTGGAKFYWVVVILLVGLYIASGLFIFLRKESQAESTPVISGTAEEIQIDDAE